MSVKIMRRVIVCHGCGTAIKAFIGKVVLVLDQGGLAVLKLMEDLFVHALIILIMFMCSYT
jgi:hypothetical protein